MQALSRFVSSDRRFASATLASARATATPASARAFAASAACSDWSEVIFWSAKVIIRSYCARASATVASASVIRAPARVERCTTVRERSLQLVGVELRQHLADFDRVVLIDDYGPTVPDSSLEISTWLVGSTVPVAVTVTVRSPRAAGAVT